jgi:hypothetical protein
MAGGVSFYAPFPFSLGLSFPPSPSPFPLFSVRVCNKTKILVARDERV